ncbi:cupin domain-containing protein [Thalassotalea sp. PLHSN55]|uniref:cupin domain-containing protein n=1 Tax=Thalassotalea sp. PLHSN55 TaxID=3435888 RepID=UPI003F8287E8
MSLHKAIVLMFIWLITINCYAFTENVNQVKVSQAKLSQEQLIQTKVVPAKEAHVTHYQGSHFLTYFIGETLGTKNAIAGVATIEPNNEIHPAHRHNEEEYLMILEGSGLWTINDETFAANAGDILYAAPGDLHGLFNNGTKTMKFVVFKYQAKPIPKTKAEPKR